MPFFRVLSEMNFFNFRFSPSTDNRSNWPKTWFWAWTLKCLPSSRTTAWRQRPATSSSLPWLWATMGNRETAVDSPRTKWRCLLEKVRSELIWHHFHFHFQPLHKLSLPFRDGAKTVFAGQRKYIWWLFISPLPSSEIRLPLRLEYEHYGSVITSDRLIQLSVFTIDKQTVDYHKAEKTIVLDEPDIEIEVCLADSWDVLETFI